MFDLVLLDLGCVMATAASCCSIRNASPRAGAHVRSAPDPMTLVLIMTARDQVR
jgi:hypothetical protein